MVGLIDFVAAATAVKMSATESTELDAATDDLTMDAVEPEFLELDAAADDLAMDADEPEFLEVDRRYKTWA